MHWSSLARHAAYISHIEIAVHIVRGAQLLCVSPGSARPRCAGRFLIAAPTAQPYLHPLDEDLHTSRRSLAA